ncbi:hypothetical protein QTP70_023668 [Hemibagrus guttatus]|uniref:Uncharacterized protein n=1 Tax=Hemibagrus guttatus TaxID=175788 RepID=A0AAE0QA68_9TELE|nr:hypothetical protein QTP70_023668 [Hemibagrus guttatus]
MHVFGPGEETGVPGGNPRGTGRTCKLHTHGRGRNQTPNPGATRKPLRNNSKAEPLQYPAFDRLYRSDYILNLGLDSGMDSTTSAVLM